MGRWGYLWLRPFDTRALCQDCGDGNARHCGSFHARLGCSNGYIFFFYTTAFVWHFFLVLEQSTFNTEAVGHCPCLVGNAGNPSIGLVCS